MGKLLRVEGGHLFVSHHERFLVHAFLLGLRVLLLLIDFHTTHLAQLLYRVNEGQPISLLQEADGITTIPTSEALIGTCMWEHEEGGCLLSVEGTAAHVPRP